MGTINPGDRVRFRRPWVVLDVFVNPNGQDEALIALRPSVRKSGPLASITQWVPLEEVEVVPAIPYEGA